MQLNNINDKEKMYIKNLTEILNKKQEFKKDYHATKTNSTKTTYSGGDGKNIYIYF
jgi:hypothetical protein